MKDTVKILKDSLKLADGGRVECTVMTQNGPKRGVIMETFFQDSLGNAMPSPHLKMDFTARSLAYLESIAQQQLDQGEQEVIIR